MSRQQLGTTMIELMISMALGMAIIAGISEIFLQSQKSGKIQRSLSHMMEDGSYVTEMFSKELRRTGFLRSPQAFNGKANNIFGVDTNAVMGTPLTSIPQITLGQGEYIHGAVAGASQDVFVFRYQLNDRKDDPSSGSSPCTKDLGLGAIPTPPTLDTENPATNVQLVTIYFMCMKLLTMKLQTLSLLRPPMSLVYIVEPKEN